MKISTIHFLNKLANSSGNLKPFRFVLNWNIVQILFKLEENGYISYKIEHSKDCKYAHIYFTNNKINKVIFISKPSRVIRISAKRLKSIKYFCILSTNQGILTNEEAIKANTGGILLFKLKIK